MSRSNLDTSNEVYTFSKSNLDLSNSQTSISAITLNGTDIRTRAPLQPDGISISVAPDVWSSNAATDVLSVTVQDNSVANDTTFDGTASISVDIFEPYFDGVTETTPSPSQITAFRGQERNFVIGGDDASVFRVGVGVVGHNVYLVAPSRFTGFQLINTMTNVPTDVTAISNINFQHANPAQGNVQYTIWLVGTYTGPIEFRVEPTS